MKRTEGAAQQPSIQLILGWFEKKKNHVSRRFFRTAPNRTGLDHAKPEWLTLIVLRTIDHTGAIRKNFVTKSMRQLYQVTWNNVVIYTKNK
jgi:hypothetical protein